MSTISQQNSDQYLSISAPSTGIYKDNGSKFLAFAYPVESEEQVKEHLAALRKEYFDARHHCYAYRIGHLGQIWRANDDGEPSSTAGKPILGQLLSSELSDILVVVVRYFGGVKLGVPGLIKAYKTATSEALSAASTITKTASATYEITFGYEDQGRAMKTIKDMALPVVSQHFDAICKITVRVRLTQIQAFGKAFEWTSSKKID
ncbi:MAG: YigZ family protein [Bacteroidales bacterium]|nr:YigZ family protein [Bacteroidales bacterium]